MAFYMFVFKEELLINILYSKRSSRELWWSYIEFRISESNLKERYKDEPFMHAIESNTLESNMKELEETLDSLEVK